MKGAFGMPRGFFSSEKTCFTTAAIGNMQKKIGPVFQRRAWREVCAAAIAGLTSNFGTL